MTKNLSVLYLLNQLPDLDQTTTDTLLRGPYLDKQKFQRKILNIFLPINLTI